MSKIKVYFDKEYNNNISGIDKLITSYVVRIEGVVTDETELEYKVKTTTFWSSNGYYGLTVVKYPKHTETRQRLQNYRLERLISVQDYYWVPKLETIIIK